MAIFGKRQASCCDKYTDPRNSDGILERKGCEDNVLI